MGWIFSEWCRSQARLDGKTVVITGCNTGIGKETAREFYKRGGKVIMACRNIEKAEQAAEDIKKVCQGLPNLGELIIKELDLGSLESVRKCAAEILETQSAIHLLVNNAGIMACPKYFSKDGYELQFATNHLGHFLFTLLLLPRIIQSAPARIVILSSSAHAYGDGKMHLDDINLDKGYSPSNAYCRSKLANVYFAVELARRLEGTGVNVYSLHPGVINTELGRHIEESHPWLSAILLPIARLFIKTPIQGAQTTLYCSLDEKCANETGLYYAECAVKKAHLRSKADEKAKQLWDESIKLVNLQDYNPFPSTST
ncbi:retinol dehydrogenase 13-like [Planococcus citri]|uniref:retinol dehydrogenase 13-like n=1 Tax=Planococcus citri TaxID=170843 RepID=UPI0031F9FC08